LAAAGSKVTVVDYRKGQRLASAHGRGRVSAVTLEDGTRITADAVLTSGGFTPTLHLY